MIKNTKSNLTLKYQVFNLSNFKQIPQLSRLNNEQLFDIEVVGNVLPFKTNNYVINNLINWNNVPNDPIFILTFPQRDMLLPPHYYLMADALKNKLPKNEIKTIANRIRMELNPHPAGQVDHNIPTLDGVKQPGIQHKYRETVLFFPSQGQTCHAYCTFCFRWPQFVGMDEMKFASREADNLAKYVIKHPEVTDVLFTGGDPLIMKTKILEEYINALLEVNSTNLQTIRIGTKALSYWPYRFTGDDDAEDLLRLFDKVVKRGINLAIMAHFNHPAELEPDVVKDAIRKIRNTGAQIRTQSPVLKHINDDPNLWAEMWRKQVNLNCIPYYMFIPRDTGAQHYFALPLTQTWEIFRKAYQQVSGVCRTVRGPSMSCNAGKVQILGIADFPMNKKLISMRFLQGRNPDWAARPFFAEYNKSAKWIDELTPAFGEEKFFFEDELNEICKEKIINE